MQNFERILNTGMKTEGMLAAWLILAVAVAIGIYSYIKAKRNRISQAIGFALIPGLWLGSLVWCLLSGQIGLIFLVFILIGIFLMYLCFSYKL